MHLFYFVFEIEPQVENPLIAHVSRAVVHIWVVSDEIHEARKRSQHYLQSERWEVIEEKKAYLPTAEHISELSAEDSTNYQAAQAEGIHATFYYWHRSE